MSRDSLFYYFSNKQAIISAIIDHEGKETEGISVISTRATISMVYGAFIEFMDVVLGLVAYIDFLSLALEIAA